MRLRIRLCARLITATLLWPACSGDGDRAAGAADAAAVSGGEADAGSGADAAPTGGFSWRMAGALALWGEPLTASPSALLADHFSYVGQYAMNGCASNTSPYSCAANGCNYPGNPLSSEVAPSYEELAAWVGAQQAEGLFAGIWAVTYEAPEAEAHCMAEIANTLRAEQGAVIDFLVVDAEKSYETHKADGYTQRFVDTFDAAIAFSLARAEAPECHIDIDYGYWAAHDFAIQSQAYWNAYGVNPSWCLDWVRRYGVPDDMNQVMLDGWAAGPDAAHSPGDYADDIATFGGVGFSIWRTLPSADAWDTWRALIETRSIADYPPPG